VLHRDAAEGVHRVEDAYTNWYLVEDGSELTVVDTGLPSSWGSLQNALSELGRKPSDIAAVVLTHGHFDHVGFAHRARKELGVPVLAHEDEVHLVRHPWSYDHERSRLRYVVEHPRFGWIFTRMGASGALWVKGVEDPETYRGGEVLDVPGRPKVVFTPGHTYGHSALHLRERGLVIAGDAIVTFDPYTTREGPRIVAGAATADSARALDSLDQLAATGADTVLVGHGEPWTGGAARAAELAREAGPA
jgi:glyoxylase-like metal-dependent hydrolase (beta-lactamase superfamily II)